MRYEEVVQQKAERLVDRRLFYQMVIVEDKNCVLRHVRGGLDERCQHRLALRRWAAEKSPQLALHNPRLRRLPRSQQVAEEALDIIIPFVERQPGDRVGAGTRPLGEQRRLAVAGGSRNQEQFIVGDSALESVDEVFAGDEDRWPGWNAHFGCQKNRIHRTTTLRRFPSTVLL